MDAAWSGYDGAFSPISPDSLDWMHDYHQAAALPTPPPSNESSPCQFQFSPVFHPAALGVHSDLVFASLDCILFYVNSKTLTRISKNAFEDQIAQCSGPVSISGYIQVVVHIPETSEMLDTMLHILYDLPFSSHTPSFHSIAEALTAMTKYEIYPSFHLVPSHPCSKDLLSFAALHPLELYTLAAQFDIYHLAASASSHLLSYPPWTITDDVAKQIGAIYVKKLLSLYAYRTDALKKIILAPPESHALSESCTFSQTKKLERTWAAAAARLVWEIKPDLSPVTIRTTFKAVGDQITCAQCKEALDARIKDVVNRWVCVKRTI